MPTKSLTLPRALGAAAVVAVAVAATTTAAPPPAGAAFTPAEWSCTPSVVAPYTATVPVTISNVVRKNKFDGTIAAVAAKITTSVTAGSFPGTFGFYASNPFGSTTATPVVSTTAQRGNNSLSLFPPNDTHTSGWVAFDPDPGSKFCAASAVVP
ncbi:hypothetical protein GCM10022215_27820 [Nocardioides fonticola]|uniref:Secreted protein n=1 Tax=Nocardioides fonticola TaxID=450363 RepID=A0ABP7XNH7_9ACTN